MYGQFARKISEDDNKEKTWEWTRSSDLKVETLKLAFARKLNKKVYINC